MKATILLLITVLALGCASPNYLVEANDYHQKPLKSTDRWFGKYKGRVQGGNMPRWEIEYAKFEGLGRHDGTESWGTRYVALDQIKDKVKYDWKYGDTVYVIKGKVLNGSYLVRASAWKTPKEIYEYIKQ